MPQWHTCQDIDGDNIASLTTNSNHDFRKSLHADVSYMFATAYIGILTLAALFVCYRSRTRLRLYAAFCTCLALTVTVVGLLRSKLIISPTLFWLWNFVAEPVGIVALMFTIASVGNGFYPMTGNSNPCWRVAIGLIIFYALVAAANVALYIQQKVVFHAISGETIAQIRKNIIAAGIRTEDQLLTQEFLMQCLNLIPPGNRLETGVANWTGLTWTERAYYARPARWAYSTHQMLMIFTFAWVSAYLFVPLLRHHRRRAGVGRPVDGDMMAVGVWYMSCISTLVLAYAILNIYYCFVSDNIYDQQSQALDLCIRTTIGPIFFVPAPASLIKFYRRHFSNSGKGSNSGGGYRGRYDSTGGNIGYHSSFANPEEPTGMLVVPCSRAGSRIGCTEDGGYVKPAIEDSKHQMESNGNNRHTSLGSMYGRIRFFHSRNRGSSMESNKVFNQDFEQDDAPDSQHTLDDNVHRRDSFHQYYGNMNPGRTQSDDSTVYEGSTAAQFASDVNRNESKSRADSSTVNVELQRPKPALTASNVSDRQPVSSWNLATLTYTPYEIGTALPESPIHPERSAVQETRVDLQAYIADKKENSPLASPDTIGTTGWEVGGWGHTRQSSDCNNEISLSHPLELPYPSPSPSPSPRPSDLLPAEGTEFEAQSTEVDIGNHSPSPGTPEPSFINNGRELTGLQKQLAEYKSALLPVVMAMRDLDARGPPSVTFESRDDMDGYLDEARYDLGHHSHHRPRTGGRGEKIATDNPPLSNDTPTSSVFKYLSGGQSESANTVSTKSSAPGLTHEKENAVGHNQVSTGHSVDPLHWSKLPSSPTKKSGFLSGRGGDAEGNGEKPVAGFKKKWLAGRKSTEGDRQFLQSKFFEADHSSTCNKASTGENNNNSSNKHNSGSNFALEVGSPIKNSRAKDSRLSVFSKVLSGNGHKSAERTHPNQDISDQDREHSTTVNSTKPEVKISSSVHISAPIPATVEALALSSTNSRLVDEDEDRGLQYYYPDPYSSLAEFKRPQGHALNLGPSTSVLDRAAHSSSQRHPLSPRPSNDGRGLDPSFVNKGDTGVKLSEASNLSPASDDTSNKSSSGKHSKSVHSSSKKSLKVEAAVSCSQGVASTAASSVSSGMFTAPASYSNSPSAGSSVSRSGSLSKKSKLKLRSNRSKSDAPIGRSSTDTGPIISPVITTTVLPITTTRKPSSGPVITQPTKTSLSPPPRQSWTRSKSFQGTTSAITAAILSKTMGTSDQFGSSFIEPTVANDQQSETGNTDADLPSGQTRNSLTLSVDSPKNGLTSPLISPLNDVFDGIASKIGSSSNTSSPTSSPSSPPTTSFPRLGGSIKTRPQEYRHNSLDREIEYRTSLNKDRTGYSTAAMDLRRASSRPQRSIDNLASAYYYKRAAELSSKGNSGVSEREVDPNSNESSNSILSSSSPQIGSHSGFSYYGVGGGESERSSPTPYQSSSSHRNSGSYTPQYQKSKSSLDYSIPGVGGATTTATGGGSQRSSFARTNEGSNEHNRTGSLTNSSHLMAEDPWTQALIARASGVGTARNNGNDSRPGSTPPSSQSSSHAPKRGLTGVCVDPSVQTNLILAGQQQQRQQQQQLLYTGSSGAGGAYQKHSG
ncbi:hypothetical protein BGX28_002337 [Mortierella sp. GBA30]|nr:hypothetical protein BGX28_002337 [Mortierella sp. GBA30]